MSVGGVRGSGPPAGCPLHPNIPRNEFQVTQKEVQMSKKIGISVSVIGVLSNI